MRLLDRAPGGRGSVLVRLPEADRSFFDELFLESGWYAMEPYVRLMQFLAKSRGQSLRAWMCHQAELTASNDAEGIYRRSLESASPREMAKRLPRAFNRYFRPPHAELAELGEDFADFELSAIPVAMEDFFRGVNDGFVMGALKYAGAPDPKVVYRDSRRGARHAGYDTVVLPFRAEF